MPVPAFLLALIPWIKPIISLTAAGIGAAMMISQNRKDSKSATDSAAARKKSGKYALDTEELKQVSNLSDAEQKTIESLLPFLTDHAEDFLREFPKLDTAKLEQIAQQQPQTPQIPGAQELGFPQVPDLTGDIRSETDFAPIEKQSMRNFQEQILPMIKEQFAGVGGGTRSSAYRGETQAGGERLAESLAALRSKYGLERGSVLGQLGLKQSAIEQQRALGAGQVGSQRYQLGQQDKTQQFGQQLDLANLGLAENNQTLQQNQQGLNTMGMILNRGGLTNVIPQQPAQSNLGQQLVGQGLKMAGKIDYGDLYKQFGKTGGV